MNKRSTKIGNILILVDTVKEFDNLQIVAAQHDTAIYDLPPVPTGERGRPRKKGRKLNVKAALNDQNEDACTSKTLTTYRIRWNIEVMFY